MKKYLILFAIFFCQLAAAPIQDHRIDPAALSQLATTLGISAGDNFIEQTQKQWLRKPGQERWEQTELLPDQRQFVLNWAREQGFFQTWKPATNTYDKALILGATASRMQTRLDYLAQLWNEGVRFNEIVWLTGDRPLDSRVDGMTELCQNESQAARLIWEKANLPEDMRHLSVLFVAVPMKGQLRPNTQDTLIAWLNTKPTPCKALFISDQPFCGYQFAVIRSSLPDEFLFDVAGKGVDSLNHPAAAAITLDSIARWIYQDSLDNRP